MKMTDYTFENHGSLFLVRPHNDAAEAWLVEHTDGQWLGGALAVEHRYAAGLAEGLIDDGFTVG
jgi:hypothetical protein